MTRLRNPYLWVLLLPLLGFILVMLLGVDPDHVNLAGRLYFFGLLGYVGARYVGRAPVLMWRGDTTPEGRNIVGFALFIVAIMLTQAYAWIAISAGRPAWLAEAYYSPALVVLAGVGVTLVASSVPRFPFPPANGNGLTRWTSFLVGFLSATALLMAQHLPALWKLVTVWLSGMARAF